MQIKGLEIPAHDPRFHNGSALEYATSTYGASHMSAIASRISPEFSWPDLGIPPMAPNAAAEGMGTAVAKLQHMMCLFDSLSCCKFPFIATG